jgi:hypothetical protein
VIVHCQRTIGPVVEVDGECEIRVLRVPGDRKVRFRDGDGERLLAQHVQAMLERGDRERHVLEMRRRENDRVDGSAGDQRVRFGKRARADP